MWLSRPFFSESRYPVSGGFMEGSLPPPHVLCLGFLSKLFKILQVKIFGILDTISQKKFKSLKNKNKL